VHQVQSDTGKLYLARYGLFVPDRLGTQSRLRVFHDGGRRACRRPASPTRWSNGPARVWPPAPDRRSGARRWDGRARLWLPNSELKAEGTEFDSGTARPVAPKEPPSSANQPGHWISSLACGASP